MDSQIGLHQLFQTSLSCLHFVLKGLQCSNTHDRAYVDWSNNHHLIPVHNVTGGTYLPTFPWFPGQFPKTRLNLKNRQCNSCHIVEWNPPQYISPIAKSQYQVKPPAKFTTLKVHYTQGSPHSRFTTINVHHNQCSPLQVFLEEQLGVNMGSSQVLSPLVHQPAQSAEDPLCLCGSGWSTEILPGR